MAGEGALTADPFVSTSLLNFNKNVNRTENVGGTERDFYTPNQMALQGNALDFIGKILGGGGMQAGFQAPSDATRAAAWHDFRKYQMPQLAAMHGAGSPTIQAAGEELNLKLAALGEQSYQSSFRNMIDAFGAAAHWAFQPGGRDESKTGKILEGTSGFEQQTGANIGNILEAIVGPGRTF